MCARAGIRFLKLNGRYDLIDDYSRTDSYKESYAHAIVPFPKPDSIDDEGSVISFPEHHQTRARTKQRWISSQGEKMPRPIKCGK